MYYLVEGLRKRLPKYDIIYDYIEEEKERYVKIYIEDEKGKLVAKLKVKVNNIEKISEIKEIEEKIVNFVKGIKEIEEVRK